MFKLLKVKVSLTNKTNSLFPLFWIEKLEKFWLVIPLNNLDKAATLSLGWFTFEVIVSRSDWRILLVPCFAFIFKTVITLLISVHIVSNNKSPKA
ncbi:MAG: hypothetical protein ACRDAW_00920 [Metamycoplasmataceae bacterium]